MALHHQVGDSRGCEAVEPALEKIVEGGLADADWRVGKDAVEADFVGHFVGGYDGDPVADPDSGRVGGGECSRPLIHIDCPDSCLRSSMGGDAGYGPPTATQVENGEVGWGERWRFEQQELGACVEAAGREYSPITGEFEGDVGEVHLHPRR